MSEQYNQSRPHVNDLISGMRGFELIDYSIFVAMLSLSAAIGVYFGYKEKQKNQTNTQRHRDSIELDYLVGGRKLKIFPVAMSLTASAVSGIAIMGMSSEVYIYGTQFTFFILAITLGSAAVHYIFIPVVHDLRITSTFEYLELRFDKKIRMLSALFSVFTLMIWLPVVFYATALAFNQMTGISIHIITPITCSICIFYTCLGGIKAVVWTDVIQIVIMFGTMIIIAIKGTIDIGLGNVVDHNAESGRLELPELTFDPMVRHSMFSVVLGGIFIWAHNSAFSQMFMQRFVSLPTVNAARKSLWIFTCSAGILFALCYYCGMLAYGKYHDCDPMLTGMSKTKDQIIPVMVMDLFRNVPGIPGIFVSGIFSAALSSLSTALNSLSAIILEDFIKQIMNIRPSVCVTNFIMRSSVVICGLICVALVFVVEKMGNILQLSFTISGSTVGPFFAIYLMGLLMPRINTKSAFIGSCGGLIVMLYIVIRAQLDQYAGKIHFPTKPVAVDNCPYDFDLLSNKTILVMIPADEGFQLHRISYMLYSVLGAFVTVLISTIASFFVKRDGSEVRADLLAPFIRSWCPTALEKIKKNEKIEVIHRFDNNKSDY